MDFLIFIGGVIGLVWGAVLFRRGGLLAGSLVMLLAAICFGHPFFHVALGPLPITIDRLLLGLLIVLAIVYRRFGKTTPKPFTPADWTLIVFTLVLAISTFTHDWHINKLAPASQLLFFYVLPLMFYFIVREINITERAILGMFAALAVFGVYLSITAIAEAHQLWGLVYPKYIASTTFVEFYGRGRGPLLNPAGSGILQGLCLCGALMWWPRLNRYGQLAMLAVVPLYAWGIYDTFTRSAWLGGGLGLMILFGLTLPRLWRVPIIGTLILVSVPLVAGNWERVLSFKRDKELSAADVADSARLRPILAAVAWHMFQDRPLFGCGFGQYMTESLPYLSDRSIDLPLEKARPYVQHNSFLALLTETGLIGMGLFCATLLLWMKQAWRLWRTTTAPLLYRQIGLLFFAFLGNWFANAMFQDVLIIPVINLLLYFMAGLALNLSLTVAAQNSLVPAVAGRGELARRSGDRWDHSMFGQNPA